MLSQPISWNETIAMHFVFLAISTKDEWVWAIQHLYITKFIYAVAEIWDSSGFYQSQKQSLPKLVFILSEASVFGTRREKIVALSHARESDNMIHII